MNNFRTTFTIPEYPIKLNYHSKSMFIGSCFSENIGNYLKEIRFNIVQNPTGILYNPISINECLGFLINSKRFNEDNLNFNNDVWFSFHHHGRFSNTDKNKCLEKINSEMQAALEFLVQSDFIFLTFGSAYYYRHNQTNEVVANCHKLPPNTFIKSLSDVETINNNYLETIEKLHKINTGLKIIFTVSPVRHFKDGAIENQLSKSILFVAINEIIKNFDYCFYFPSYELMMDDLRDYRFYNEDMMHPNNSAIEYIKDRFTDALIDKSSQDIMKEIQKLLLAKNHKTFHTGTPAYRKFKETQLNSVFELKKQFPFLNLDEFEKYFR